MRVERAVASGARHCTPHTATGAGAMAEESSRTAAGGMDHAGVVQSLDERLETSRPLERDEVGGTRADVSMPEMPAEDPVKDLLTRKESELMALRSRRVSDLESRVERGATELAELRSRMHQLREDFQYNLNLLDERDGELERYDAQFARAATEAEDAARQVREARLAAQEAVSEARRWQQRASESEAHHARRVAEMRDAVERERFNRDESLLRQREEFDAHKRALMRQIAERDELLETAQSDARDAVAAEARRAREGVDVEKHDADAEASARKAEKEALERRVEEARRRAAAAEQEAEAARAAKAEAERAASEARRAAAEAQRAGDAELATLREKLETSERRGARLSEDADAAAAAAAAAVRLAEAAAEDARQEAAAAGLRRDAEYAAESAALAARGDALATRADAAERALEETRAAARATRRELEARFAESSSADRVRDASRASDALVNAERALAEKEDAVAAKRHAERALAAAGARETSLAEQMARLRFESDAKDAALAAANERAHAAARAAAETRAESEHFARQTSDAARAEGDERAARLAARCASLEAKLVDAEAAARAAAASRDAARGELEATRRAFEKRAAARRDADALAAVTAAHRERRGAASGPGSGPGSGPASGPGSGPPPLEVLESGRAPATSASVSGASAASALETENARLRLSVAAMRAEMETMQRAAFEHAGSTPGSTPRLLAQTLGSASMPPSPSVFAEPHPPPSPARPGASVELELARAEVKRLTRDKEKLLEMANGLRAELDREHLRSEARAVSVLTENAPRESTNDLALAGSPPAFTARRVRADYVRGENVKASDRATESQRSALKKTARQTEVRRVRNWNVTADETEPRDTVVVHQR